MLRVKHRQILRRRIARACVLLFMPALFAPVQAAETVQSLRYGASLFHFYQRDYFNALTELMAGQQLDALGAHTEGAEMLRGGMALSYGMDREAAAIFESEIETTYDSVNKDHAWFYLGKLAWQRGELGRTLDSLSRMDPAYEGPLVLEANYLHASALIKHGDASRAADIWGDMPYKSLWRRHLGYNLGANHAVQGDWWKASHYFSTVSKALSDSTEERELADKANTAAGYAFLSSGEFEKSSDEFRKVRLSGSYTTRALLGYGWSALEQGDYLAALGPWQQLAEGSILDDSVREGLLAVPYAYGRLDRPAVALEKYQFAHAQYAQALTDLNRAIKAFQEEPLGSLLGIEEQGSADWLFDQDILPSGEHSPYVEHLVAQHGFQVALRELNDLYSVAAQLSRAQKRLDVLVEVDAHQQAVWTSVAEEDRRNKLAGRQQELALSYNSLKEKLQQAIAQNDGRQLAPAEQAERWTRLERAEALADNVGQQEKYSQRLRLIRGLMTWSDNEEFPARAWRTQVSINELDALTVETVRALQQVDEAVASQKQSSFAPRIAHLIGEVDANSGLVQVSIARSEMQLRQLAVAELEQQAEQLARAMGQSQLAIAQIHDSGREGAGHE
jgi:hypothetical protein